jgi:predicted RNase H-like nuclease (RuvC/YqgF family)
LTIAADKNKNSGKYSEEISDLEKKIVALKEKQEDLNRSNTNYDQLIQILNSKKHPMTL